MNCPRAALFDLDDTLAESFMPPKPEMTERLERLLNLIPIAIITGRDFSRIEPEFLPALTASPHVERLFVLPESSSQCFSWNGTAWKEEYSSELSADERAKIREAIEESVTETNVLDGLPRFGEQFLEKHAQTAFAMLGLQVPSALKYSWDPGDVRRKKLQAAIAKKLPEFEVLLGGATSMDITKKGIDKSYGVRWLSQRLGIPINEMLYVGDALHDGGNDFVVIKTGIQTRAVSAVAETARVLDELLAACSA